jgi:BirA family transcriptional regulator, biotin operon repressor / biotin---[acetyl-CoA-carboxylase] ligase
MHNIQPNTHFVGKNVVYLPTCHSTNNFALDWLAEKTPVPEGTFIYTSHQTAGRGQRGNTWEAEPGKNFTGTIIFHPVFLEATRQFDLNMAVSLAVFDTLQFFLDDEFLKIKWSNDLFYKDKKLGGILLENHVKNTRLEHSVVGIGLNVNQKHFGEAKAISLRQILDKEISLEELINRLLENLEKYYLLLQNGRQKILKNMYLKKLYRMNETHFFKTAGGEIFAGTIIGIDENGRLCVEKNNRTEVFDFKEIVFL